MYLESEKGTENLATAIAIGKAWAKMGWAVQQQLESLVDMMQPDINPNAVTLMEEFVAVVDRELDENGDAGARKELDAMVAIAKRFPEDDEE